jgi:CubicO group peptidase (beta-lactamase class C family)
MPFGTCFALLVAGLSGCTSSPYTDFASARADTAAKRGEGLPAEGVELRREQVEDLAPWLAPFTEKHRLPALAAVVLRGDEIIAEGVTGVRRMGAPTPATLSDQFHIASCAKALSATLIAALVEEGQLEWETPIADYFPGLEVHPSWQQITVRHLVTHTAGLRDPLAALLKSTYFGDGSPQERRQALAHRLLRSSPAHPPGHEVRYCNIGYILLGAVAEHVTGEPWEQLMRTRLFTPLGMHSAGFGPPGTPGQTDQPWGHGKRRLLQIGLMGLTAFDPGGAGADYPAFASPAGYIHLTMFDWAAFVSLQLRAHRAGPESATNWLDPEVFATPRGSEGDNAYSGGWYVSSRRWAKGDHADDNGRVLYHVGDNGRWTSVAWVAPEIDLALLMVCNRGDAAAALDDAVGQLVTRYARKR